MDILKAARRPCTTQVVSATCPHSVSFCGITVNCHQASFYHDDVFHGLSLVATNLFAWVALMVGKKEDI
jgi:hypothetical protein